MEQAKRDYSFEELAALNDGVILDPLRAKGDVTKLPDNVITGIATISRNEMEPFIASYSNSPEETTDLNRRYRAIKQMHSQVVAQSIEPLVTTPPEIPKRPAKEKKRPETIDETIERLLFSEEGAPVFDRMPDLIAKRPTDPNLLGTIYTALAEHGYEVHKDDENPYRDAFMQNAGDGYNRHLFGRKEYMRDEKLLRLIATWVPTVTLNEPEIITTFKQAVIMQAVRCTDPGKTYSGLCKVMDTTIDPIVTIVRESRTDSDTAMALWGDIFKAVYDKLHSYPAEIRAKIDDLVRLSKQMRQENTNAAIKKARHQNMLPFVELASTLSGSAQSPTLEVLGRITSTLESTKQTTE